jgi:uncharacterized protein
MTLMDENFNEFLARLEERVRTLPVSHQMAFSASCCERAFPNYSRFSREVHWGDPGVFRLALDRMWDHIRTGNLARWEAEGLESDCKALTPDSEQFSSPEGSAAQEAAFMITLLLRSSYDDKPTYPVRIATFNRDTIDMFVQLRENLNPADPDLELKIERNQLMRSELAKQEHDLDLLLSAHDDYNLQAFEVHARAMGQDNLGLQAH